MAHRDAVRITTAPQSRAEELAARQRRYLISMAIRIVCFVAAWAVGPGWLRWVFVAGAVFLPYVAVVLANAGDQRDERFTLDPPPPQHVLEAGSPESLDPRDDT